MRKLLTTTALVAGALWFGVPVTAQATAINYQAGQSAPSLPLFGIADFTTSAGLINITLTNGLAADVIRSAGQGLSDLSFTLSNAPGTLGAATATGQQGNISNSGVVTYTTGSPGRFLGTGGGGVFSITGNTILMEAIGGGKPDQMITPAIANGGTYTNVNGGFDNFNPYTIGPATFVLNLPGVTADTTVTAASFSFGTKPDTFLPGSTCVDCGPGTLGNNGDPVPEPASLGLFGVGLLGLGFVTAKRRK